MKTKPVSIDWSKDDVMRLCGYRDRLMSSRFIHLDKAPGARRVLDKCLSVLKAPPNAPQQPLRDQKPDKKKQPNNSKKNDDDDDNDDDNDDDDDGAEDDIDEDTQPLDKTLSTPHKHASVATVVRQQRAQRQGRAWRLDPCVAVPRARRAATLPSAHDDVGTLVRAFLDNNAPSKPSKRALKLRESVRESLQERMSLFGLTALQLSEESQHDNDDNEAEAVEEENVVVTVNDALSRTTPNNTSATTEPPSVLSKEPKALSQAFDLSKKARKKRRAESDNKPNKKPKTKKKKTSNKPKSAHDQIAETKQFLKDIGLKKRK